MKKSLLVFSSFVLSANVLAECVPPKVSVDYPEDIPHVGVYHRVHPSGNYVLASKASGTIYGNNVVIIDLTGKNEAGEIEAKGIATPMIDETYPIEGNWDMFASPNHGDGMRYYKWDDILNKQKGAQPVLTDREHNEWYHSSAERPGSNKRDFKFRTMLYGNRYRDYSMSFDDKGNLKDKTISQTKRACTNITNYLDSPILSKDGSEVASLHGRATVILKINDEDSTCQIVDELGVYTSKVNFSYPKPGTKGQVVYVANTITQVNGQYREVSGIHIYDRDSKVHKRLSLPTESSASYPGMTEDGRVVYINRRERQIVTVDPNQIDGNGNERPGTPNCIRKVGVSTSSPVRKAPDIPNAIAQ